MTSIDSTYTESLQKAHNDSSPKQSKPFSFKPLETKEPNQEIEEFLNDESKITSFMEKLSRTEVKILYKFKNRFINKEQNNPYERNDEL